MRERARACTRGDATSLSNCLETRADPLSPAFNRSRIFLPPPHGFSFLLFIVNSPTSPITSPLFHFSTLLSCLSFFLHSTINFHKKRNYFSSYVRAFRPREFENSCKPRLILASRIEQWRTRGAKIISFGHVCLRGYVRGLFFK